MTTLTYLSLFSGIGGLDLGLDRAGWTCVGQVEKDEFCQRVLAKHWPEVPRHDDVRTAPAWWLGTARPAVDLVVGGFPCQPFSTAGRRQGMADERWGWPWFADVVRVVRPRYVLVENVAALTRSADAFGTILADLAACGYDADWDCIPAAAVGAPHRRDRLFLVAHTGPQAERGFDPGRGVEQPEGGEGAGNVAHAAGGGRNERRHLPESPRRDEISHAAWRSPDVADSDSPGRAWTLRTLNEGRPGALGRRPALLGGRSQPCRFPWWDVEPDVGRVAYGVPARVDRLRALGNAVVPQVAELIGRLILDHTQAVTRP